MNITNITEKIYKDYGLLFFDKGLLPETLDNYTLNKFTIEDAIKELVDAFEKNYFSDPLNNEMYFNIKRMKNLRLKSLTL